MKGSRSPYQDPVDALHMRRNNSRCLQTRTGSEYGLGPMLASATALASPGWPWRTSYCQLVRARHSVYFYNRGGCENSSPLLIIPIQSFPVEISTIFRFEISHTTSDKARQSFLWLGLIFPVGSRVP